VRVGKWEGEAGDWKAPSKQTPGTKEAPTGINDECLMTNDESMTKHESEYAIRNQNARHIVAHRTGVFRSRTPLGNLFEVLVAAWRDEAQVE